MNRTMKAAIAATALVLGGAGQAVTLNFEQLAWFAPSFHSQELFGVGTEVFESGYYLRYTPAPGEPYPVGFHGVGPRWPYTYGGSMALLANSCSASTTLVAEDNNPLTLVSMDLQELNGVDGDPPPSTVTFEGVTADGLVVTHTVQLNGTRAWERVLFPASFENLQSVRWLQGDCIANPPHALDNVRVFPTWKGWE